MEFNTPVCNCLQTDWSTFGKEIANPDNNVSLLTINLRSIKYKFLELLCRLASLAFKFTFIIITETWLTAASDVGYSLPGYCCYSVTREGNRGGGVKVYYRDFLDAQIDNFMTGVYDSYEGAFFTVNTRKLGSLVVGGIYRPPSRSTDLFMNTLENFFTESNAKCILAGDFNINLLSDGSTGFINMMHEFSFECSVDAPTYFSPIAENKTSCLDHIWHNLTYKTQDFIMSPPIADHLSVAAFFIALFLKQRGIQSFGVSVIVI